MAGGQPSYTSRQAAAYTLDWLARQWMLSARWKEASASTQKQRRLTLQKICDKAGHVPADRVTRRMIVAGLDERADTPAAANWYLKVVKALFGWAVDAGHLTENPAHDIKGLKNKTDGFTPWSDADVTAYRQRWPIGSKQRLAFELLAGTGLRRGDVVRIGPQHIDGGLLSIETEKTGTVAHIAVSKELTGIIEQSQCGGNLVFLTTEQGAPYSKEGFANYFRRACASAGVKGSPHGIRKWAAAKDAESGASEMELRAKYGWETAEQSSTYTKSADRKRLARALAKRSERESVAPHLVMGEGEIAKKPTKSTVKKGGGTP